MTSEPSEGTQGDGEAGIGLRFAATGVAVASAFFCADFVLRGAALAPPRAMLGIVPLAWVALAHAVALAGSAWWARPLRAAAIALTAVALFGGMLLVAGGADAAAAQGRNFLAGGRFDSYRLLVGLLVALQGAFGVLLVWARRAPTGSPARRRRRGPMRLRRDDDD